MDALRRSMLELWQYFEKLSFNTLLYRGQAITHPSVGFLPIPEDPVRRRGSLHFWHYALDHFLSKNTGLVTIQRDWQHTNTYPISMVRFLRFLSSPSSLCRRLPSTSTAVWVPLFSSANISTGSFFSLDSVMSPPAFYDLHVSTRLPLFGCRSGSGTAFFLYLTIFLICSASSVCPFASSPSCTHEACHLANKWVFPSSHFLVRFPLFPSPVSPHCVTHSEKKKENKLAWVLPQSPSVSLPFSRGSNSIYLFPCLKCF